MSLKSTVSPAPRRAHVGAHAVLRIARDAVDENLARGRVVARQQFLAQVDFRRLEGLNWARDGLSAAGFRTKCRRSPRACRRGEVHVAEPIFVLESLFELACRVCPRSRVCASMIEKIKAAGGGDALLMLANWSMNVRTGRDLREDGHEGDESARVERAARDERPPEDEYHRTRLLHQLEQNYRFIYFKRHCLIACWSASPCPSTITSRRCRLRAPFQRRRQAPQVGPGHRPPRITIAGNAWPPAEDVVRVSAFTPWRAHLPHRRRGGLGLRKPPPSSTTM